MASTAAISAAFTTATALNVTAAQLLAQIRQMLASGLVDDGRLILGVGSDGTTITMALATAIDLDRYYTARATVEACGGIVSQGVEFAV